MAQIAAAPGLDSLAGLDARMAAIAKLEKLGEDRDAAQARRKSNGTLRRSLKAWRRGDIVRSAQLALEATEEDDCNAKAYHVLAMGLQRMGHQHKALVTYERAFALDPSDPELLINLGLAAWNMKLTESAARMFRLYVEACPDSPLGYNNLGSVQSDLGQVSIAIETLRAAIYRMPGESVLWNSLATVLAENGRVEESLVFYNEAIRLDPAFARLYHNIGYAYSHLGRLDEALGAYDRALELAVEFNERLEGRHSRSICLIGMGRLAEGFEEFEVRNDRRFRAYVHHMTKAPLWKGEPLDGKRILVVGEQGLGDEFMFASVLPDVQEAVGEQGRLDIAVDPRLIPLFRRSFPRANVGRYEDRTLVDKDGNKNLRFIPFSVDGGEPDFWAPMATPLRFFRRSLADFPHRAFLVADQSRVEYYRRELEALGSGPKIGVCWRSMMLGAKRAKYYSAFDDWGAILKTPGAIFVNLQYGDCAAEIARVRERHGVEIHCVEGLDLKNDIDGAAALSAALDLAISAPTAAAAIAGSVGTEVWFLTAGRTWPQLGSDEYPWYRKTRVFSPERFGEWSKLTPQVAASLSQFCSGFASR
ncbi:MAG TPA: tetratricopeptide repeat protein [Rhizomicrobium sp.]|jgi:tetratricopeptide (TPR) repeat protein|nr:tetratricopeptide repeat protein [Rhizomicrobium sp.]